MCLYATLLEFPYYLLIQMWDNKSCMGFLYQITNIIICMKKKKKKKDKKKAKAEKKTVATEDRKSVV